MLLINTFVLNSPNFGLPHKGVGIFLVTGFFFFWKGERVESMMKSRIVIDPMIRGGDDLVKRSFRMRNEHGMILSLQLQKTDFSVFYFILCSERAAVLAKHQFHAEISENYITRIKL